MPTPRPLNRASEAFRFFRELMFKAHAADAPIVIKQPNRNAALKFRFAAYNEFRGIRNDPGLDPEFATVISDCSISVGADGTVTIARRGADPMFAVARAELQRQGLRIETQATDGNGGGIVPTAPPTAIASSAAAAPAMTPGTLERLMAVQAEADAEREAACSAMRPANPYYTRKADGSVE